MLIFENTDVPMSENHIEEIQRLWKKIYYVLCHLDRTVEFNPILSFGTHSFSNLPTSYVKYTRKCSVV